MEVSDHCVLWGPEAYAAAAFVDGSVLEHAHILWRTFTVQQMIENGAALLLAPDGGWAVLQVYDSGRRELFVLGAYSPYGGARKGMGVLKEIAVRTDCEIISFASDIRAWERRGPQMGFELNPDGEYEMQVH